jgi:hypothetical protein
MLTDRSPKGREGESGVIIAAGAGASLLFVDIMVTEVLLCAL